MKLVWLCLLSLVACSRVVDVNHATNELAISYDTTVNAEPLSRAERIRLLDLEAYRHRTSFDALEKKRVLLQAEHDRQFAVIEKEFPECNHQLHCNSDLFRGTIERVTKYNQLISILRQGDFELFEVMRQIKKENARHDLVDRNIYNRFLAHEILDVPQSYPFFNRFMVHSLEVFSNHQEFVNRMLQFSGDVKPKIRGDLVFTMLGQEIDDAAVFLTLDLIPFFPGSGEQRQRRYLLTVLINSHHLDPQFYEKNFIREWASTLWVADRTRLKKEAYCGFYSIAASTLLDQFSKAQHYQCDELRAILHDKTRIDFVEHMATHEWLLPIAYFEPEEEY